MLKPGKGFTLVELMVVISIIALLSGIVLASLNTARSKARDVKRVLEVREIQKALAMYYNTYGSYPASASQEPGAFYDNCTSLTSFATILGPVISEKLISSLPAASTDSNLCFTYAPGQNISFEADGTNHMTPFNPSCGGKTITPKDYVILFDLENQNNNYNKYSDPEGVVTDKQYCVSP